jgi:hypothetical protein
VGIRRWRGWRGRSIGGFSFREGGFCGDKSMMYVVGTAVVVWLFVEERERRRKDVSPQLPL